MINPAPTLPGLASYRYEKQNEKTHRIPLSLKFLFTGLLAAFCRGVYFQGNSDPRVVATGDKQPE
jgi:hypothetical protein